MPPNATSPCPPAAVRERAPARRSVLAPPRAPVIDVALGLARTYAAGHVIDGAPAFAHAVRVALTLDRHLPEATAELIAAVLLRDAPTRDAPTYAAVDTVSAQVAVRCGTDTLIALWLLYDEHTVRELYRHDPAAATQRLSRLRPDIAAALTADKAVRLADVLAGAGRAADRRVYWARRRSVVLAVPYVRDFLTATAELVPGTLTDELGGLVRETHRAVMLAARAPAQAPHRSRVIVPHQ